MKEELKTWMAFILFALFVCINVACSGKSDGVRSVNSADELKTYLDKQTANSPDNPIKVAIKANNMMLDKIRKVLDESEIYVNLDFSGSQIKIIRGLSGSKNLVGITIPDSVTSIGNGNFSYCANLTSITIPDSVTCIGKMAFDCCLSLAIITIPNSVTCIGMSAFRGCTSLHSINIPNSVTCIGEGAFYNCTRLISVTFQGTIPSNEFNTSEDTFPGDLREKFYATNKTNGTPGMYTRASGGETWTRK